LFPLFSNASDIDAEIARQRGESAFITLPGGPKLPFRPVTVDLPENHRRFGAGVPGKVVAGYFLVVGLMGDTFFLDFPCQVYLTLTDILIDKTLYLIIIKIS
jgi:hypothetical protein